MQQIGNVITETATPRAKIEENILVNNTGKHKNFANSEFWRDKVHIALVAGGPSVASYLNEIKTYDHVMACGSVHDFLITHGVIPKFAVMVDPDPLIINYMQHVRKDILYLISSQCSPKVFEYLENKGCQVNIWHADGAQLEEKDRLRLFGDGTRIVGGGCTVGTRAMILAIGMGFFNQDLFGFDTCLTNDYKHHAYPFYDPTVETLGNITEIKLGGPDSPTFKVAEYMLAQLFDFKNILKAFANCLNITVFGGGPLAYILEIGRQKSNEVDLNGSAP